MRRARVSTDGVLPGVLKVRRRAPKLYRMLTEGSGAANPLEVMDWVNAWALAVNEENAAGGRVVTAPTNGAAGIVPAVLHYYRRFETGANDDGVIRFLPYRWRHRHALQKERVDLGRRDGMPGEVGVACSMAAAGLVAALHGTNEQVENAAEIGMEHNLGLTCDPVAGLVQIPCIERNAMGSVKAINAARLACVETARTRFHWIRSLPPCARPAQTCPRSTRKRRRAALPSTCRNAEACAPVTLRAGQPAKSPAAGGRDFRKRG